MANDPLATYLGCVGLVIGGIGSIIAPLSSERASTSPLFVQASLAAPPTTPSWLAAGRPAVAFHDEMIQILAPIRAEDTAPTPPEAAVPEARKDVAREVVKEKKAKTKTAERPRKRNNVVVKEDAVEEDQGPVRGGSRFRVERVSDELGDTSDSIRILGPFYER